MAEVNEQKPKAEKRATPPSRSGATVTVACKIPNGLDLQFCRKVEWDEETPSGSRKRVRYDKFGEIITVRGPATPIGDTRVQAPRLVGGYALTTGVREDFWNEWLLQNKDAPFVTAGMVFAHSKQGDTIAEAREKKDLRSGLEPLKPDTDPRRPKPVGGLAPISTADESAKPIEVEDEAA